MNVIKIQIRCKTCGKLHMEIEVEGKVNYDFKCKRCKNTNIGVITQKFNSTT
jgi:phage FluMu protein Com